MNTLLKKIGYSYQTFVCAQKERKGKGRGEERERELEEYGKREGRMERVEE